MMFAFWRMEGSGGVERLIREEGDASARILCCPFFTLSELFHTWFFDLASAWKLSPIILLGVKLQKRRHQ